MFAIPALDLVPLGAAAGTVRLPGSKSISNRLLLLAGLSEGETTLVDLLDSDDTRVMLDALQALGCRIEPDGSTTRIVGFGGRPVVAAADLFLGNAGTAMRPLTAALAVLACEHGGEYSLRGVPRMHERPIGDLVDALRGLGADGLPGAGGLPTAAPARRPARPGPAGEGARRRLQPVPHRAAAGAAAGLRRHVT
jgi:3-phosphoshikimate 1-carboxyvinyltransferase